MRAEHYVSAGTEHLTLYAYDGCFYCERVRQAAGALGLLLREKNIFREPEAASELIEARGRRTVPVLRIEREGEMSEWMPESRDIIRYLHREFGDR